MKKTKIVATIGPASDSEEMLERLINLGVNVMRLNFSHGTHEEHALRIERIKKVREKLNVPVAIMLDTKGPEIRIGVFKNGKIFINQGQKFTLTTEEVEGDETKVSVSYKEISNDVVVGGRVLIDDGLVEFNIVDKDEKNVHMVAVNSGELSDRKGVNIPDAKVKLPALTPGDISDIIFGIKNDVDYIAASFIRTREDVLSIRRILEENDGYKIGVISKIENREGVHNMDAILEVSDGIMIARGDLGVEINPEEIPHVQKELIKKCNEYGKISITATQMLDSMIRNPRPTRAEVMDVANAIIDGTSAVMLSGETAAGKYPDKSVDMMARIAISTEDGEEYRRVSGMFAEKHSLGITNSIANSAVNIANNLGANAIISLSKSGGTARAISKFRPQTDIIAITPSERALRKLSLEWGVYPILVNEDKDADKIFDEGINKCMGNILKEGDLVVLTAGLPVGKSGSTNMLKVEILSKMLGKGMGIGTGKVTARAVIANSAEELLSDFKDGDIIVTIGMERDMVSFAGRAGAIVTEEGGLTSSGAIIGLNLKVPTIVGVADATKNIKTGDIITVDIKTGEIFKGEIEHE